VIRCEHVTKVFNRGKPNEVVAVRDVSIEVNEGEVAVLRGPSGSGKTTLLSLIACVAKPTSGRVFVAGKEVSKLPERFLTLFRREHVGIIFQQFNLIPELSVVDNVVVPLIPTPLPANESRKRALALLKNLGMERRSDFKVRELSGGEQQRVAIARALVNNPRIIVADEPTAHLDTALAEEFLRIMHNLKREGRTIVIATHDPLVFQHEMVDVIFDMRDGRLVEVVR
jgi:putative ABC transport system ATP-binding protein